MDGKSRHKGSFIRAIKKGYVAILLWLLPTLINITKHISSRIKTEIAYLSPGYTFQLKIAHTKLECVCRINEKGSLKRVPHAQRALDVEAGSGLPSVDPHAVTIDYVITFRSLDYAFACFAGQTSLKGALAERAFSTRGANNTGVALTYIFTALLQTFFFWRKAYRKRRPSSPVGSG